MKLYLQAFINPVICGAMFRSSEQGLLLPVRLNDANKAAFSILVILVAERTDLALIRTGFTASSFGVGLTQIIGRGVWPAPAGSGCIPAAGIHVGDCRHGRYPYVGERLCGRFWVSSYWI
jgi:hypothetical protein